MELLGGPPFLLLQPPSEVPLAQLRVKSLRVLEESDGKRSKSGGLIDLGNLFFLSERNSLHDERKPVSNQREILELDWTSSRGL